MYIFPVSDIHTEFYIDKGKSLINSFPDADIACVAGDLGNSTTIDYGLEYLCKKYPKVIYVLGNHDVWWSSFRKIKSKMRLKEKQYSNLIFLENKRVVIEDQGFVGCTLWYEPDENCKMWPDFEFIKDADSILNRHKKSKRFLMKNIQEGDIVITHMMPSYRCVHPKYANSIWNSYFVGECEEIVLATNPMVWHSGHTHTHYDFMLNGTRMLCNSVGYPGEHGSGFDSNLLIKA